MPEVTVRRCVLRVVRHGGWSWGREPRQLVADAVQALPALLASELQRLLPADADGEIAAPLRVELRLGLQELREWAAATARHAAEAAGGDAGDAMPAGDVPAGDPVRERLRHALSALRPADRVAVAAPPRAPVETSVRPPEPRERAATVLDLLMAWHAAESIEALLRRLPDEAVAVWHRVLLDLAPDERPGPDDDGPLEATEILAPLAAQARDAALPERLRLRLLAAARLAAAAGAPATRRSVRAAIGAAIALAPDPVVALATPAARRAREDPSYRAGAGFDARLSSALPFLLLGPLHRLGWLGLLDSTMAGANLESRLPAFATALATKVLPEPERGWRRTPDAIRAAATFAGDARPRPDDEIVALARAVVPLAPALDTVIRRALLDGRHAGDPLLVCGAGGGQILVDPAGVFLIALASGGDDLAFYLHESRSPAFVPEADADAKMLARLEANGATFVTPARPVRGEAWTAVPGTSAPRLYSNRPVARMTPPRPQLVERTRDTWRAFDCRSLPGRPAEPGLDRSATLAAAVALGTIAWELWRRREATDPLLALERFSDLEGTAHFDEHKVRVRLPLGKRFRDLKEAGFLEDVPRVPWLGFRTVVFAGG